MREPSDYGIAAIRKDFTKCEDGIVKVLTDLLSKRLDLASRRGDGDEFHSAEQNARLVTDATQYYRAMYKTSARSWNLRDQHMFETLQRIMKFKEQKVRP